MPGKCLIWTRAYGQETQDTLKSYVHLQRSLRAYCQAALIFLKNIYISFQMHVARLPNEGTGNNLNSFE